MGGSQRYICTQNIHNGVELSRKDPPLVNSIRAATRGISTTITPTAIVSLYTSRPVIVETTLTAGSNHWSLTRPNRRTVEALAQKFLRG